MYPKTSLIYKCLVNLNFLVNLSLQCSIEQNRSKFLTYALHWMAISNAINLIIWICKVTTVWHFADILYIFRVNLTFQVTQGPFGFEINCLLSLKMNQRAPPSLFPILFLLDLNFKCICAFDVSNIRPPHSTLE